MERARLTLQVLEGPARGSEMQIITPADKVEPFEYSAPSLERVGRSARFRLLHQAFMMDLAPASDVLVAPRAAALHYEPYQHVPAYRALQMPRPRLLIADDTGLGKTAEAGIILRELNARRRAGRILIICPASILTQWQDELSSKFGMTFQVFDRQGIHETRRQHELGLNPWAARPRVIASMDLVKRREGAFQDLAATRWDVVIVDEAHHFAASGTDAQEVTDLHRLGRWLSQAADALVFLTATPHDGYDERFASLLGLLDPAIVPDGRLDYQKYSKYLVRRLKRHITDENGVPKFVERLPAEPVPVKLSSPERTLHEKVRLQARQLEAVADKLKGPSRASAEAIRLVSTILRKRAASSRAALSFTLHSRLESLAEREERVELRREHLRALNRGETIPDQSLRELERDAYRSHLSAMIRSKGELRRIEDEQRATEELLTLLEDCAATEDPKMVALREWLIRLPEGGKAIIFSEYIDTVEAIAAMLESDARWRGQAIVLTGEQTRARREEVLRQFAGAEKRLLVATDAASEGLNLHRHCHHLIHFELPWNPNRMEQRNGRIDRYGQTQPPTIAFIYAQETYEGEILKRLLEKMEQQIKRLGSVGDVLGPLQAAYIAARIEETPEDELQAIRDAEAAIDDELNRGAATNLAARLGSGEQDARELAAVQAAAERGLALTVDPPNFLVRAIGAAGGQAEADSGAVRVLSTPAHWRGSRDVADSYELLLPPTGDLDETVDPRMVLYPDHPLLQAALRWVRSTRFDPADDPRVAYHLVTDTAAPQMVASYVVRLQDETGQEIERLEAVLVERDLSVSIDRDADSALLWNAPGGNVPPERVRALFAPWWEDGLSAARLEAERRTRDWQLAVLEMRRFENLILTKEHEEWDVASRASIEKTGPQQRLIDLEPASGATGRRLRVHGQRAKQRWEYLERRVRFAPPQIDPLGVLLRIPAAEGGK
ncbi:MAG: helicase-related protein [Armatimonadota bacterium]